MLFSSTKFILLYLPIVFFGYFILNRQRLLLTGKYWLVIASLLFYGYWSILYLPLLIGSIALNFTIGKAVSPTIKINRTHISKRLTLTIGITINLLLLIYFKYANFFIENINTLSGTTLYIQQIVLPLGISFYTFTQIAYLVDSYKNQAKEYDFINYALFVTFFPHLIAGPILHHKEMMSQFQSRWTLTARYRNILMGLFIFSIGLFKKVMIADTFAIWADAGFASNATHDFFSAWATSLSYTFQLYFDFSGYCDMAIGAALLFNIWLPINFNSPYKSLDIQDFWRRWHMTLSRYLRDYLYVPLGGNRCTSARLYLNLMITFVLGGLWHGASWMFIIWGALHGGALIVHRIWKQLGMRLPTWLAWFVTFSFVNITWIFFRANTLDDANRLLRSMFDIQSMNDLSVDGVATSSLAWGGILSDRLTEILPIGLIANIAPLSMIAIAFAIISQKNAFDLTVQTRFGWSKIIWMTTLFSIALHSTIQSTSTVFLYFNF
ncbi:MBOAT family O-acyltransferase [Pseudomonas sp. PDM09]|uniref:MBOAT family O-acyltransferase n=1 Tax=Pseudomonas sp. PDM09 TaxID=2769270 RepID=UPI001784F511|nr:MBOAT family protein [Pseudomonas sp. PDM09]MBD9566235.1 MBOAT family protein [Pseudomonas sp. PDM09]